MGQNEQLNLYAQVFLVSGIYQDSLLKVLVQQWRWMKE